MPAIQDAYSINVSNRFDLRGDSKDDPESDNNEEMDPLEQLRLIEERREREREQKKKLKTQQANKKTQSDKKGVQFRENKDVNVPTKKEPVVSGKSDKHVKPKRESSGRDQTGNEDRQPSGDENRRPPRRRAEPRPSQRGGDGDQFGKSYDEQGGQYGRRGPATSDGDGRVEKRGGGRYERFRGSRGGGRGQSGGTYAYRYRNDGRDDRGKREFDRRSGSDRSGVRPTEKRDGGGSRNWGTPGNEIEETTTEVNAGSEEVENWADLVDNEAPTSEEKPKQEEEAKEAEEEVQEPEVEMTLDEWKALQRSRKKEFNIRQPGEGEDSSKWGNMKMIHASTVKAAEPELILEDSHKKAPSKSLVEVDIRFTDMPTRGGKGGRGGRGRGGRGSYRGGSRGGGNKQGNRYTQQLPPDLNEEEFPTLPAA